MDPSDAGLGDVGKYCVSIGWMWEFTGRGE
jgi:hypothetical protein